MNLCEDPAFIQAVATEGRSYKKEYFDTAYSLAVRHSLQLENDLVKLKKFVQRVEEVRDALEEALRQSPSHQA